MKKELDAVDHPPGNAGRVTAGDYRENLRKIFEMVAREVKTRESKRRRTLIYIRFPLYPREKIVARPPRIDLLVNVVDLVTSPNTRKLLGKLVADQADHIQNLVNADRMNAARWIFWSTWPLLLWYFAKDLVLSVTKAWRGKSVS